MKRPRKFIPLGAAFVVLTLGAAPLLSSAADHIDASAFGSLGTPGGAFSPMSVHGERDINDVYAFQGANASKTVLVMTTNPAINAFGGKFGANVRYIINVDNNGDAVQDIAYVVRFDNDEAGDQDYTVKRYRGNNAVTLAHGSVRGHGSTEGSGRAPLLGNGRVFAGVRSDPFFFDLTGFVGTLFHIGTDNLGDNPTDTFVNFNTNAIVIEVPDAELGRHIGVWGKTTWWDGSAWRAGDQMGRPAINTVFNPKADKDDFNRTPPSQQATAFGGKFRTNVVNGLIFFSSLDTASGGSYTTAQAQALAGILIPDVLTYSRTSTLPAPLNGRALADDVIDVELNITTGGDPLGLFGRDAAGAVPGDGVGPHTDYLKHFPYLGKPH